jgi:hypothetical protein
VALAIDLIETTHAAGNANFVAGSDISGFFTKIRPSEVVDFIQTQTDDDEFIDLFARALKVDLANADEIGSDELRLFPTDDVGVAQGCPLSAFAGNVILRHFDAQLNGKGIVCIRYIDDFILLGQRRAHVAKAFESAGKLLASLEMAIYRPEDRPDKAFFGPIDNRFDFLGYQLRPGLYPPARKNLDGMLAAVREELDLGRTHILRALNRGTDGHPLQLYSQTLVVVDRLLRAWSNSFKASRCIDTADEIDQTLNGLISDFIAFYRDKVGGRSQLEKRRALGVHVLADDIRLRLRSDCKSITPSRPRMTSANTLG